MRELQSIEVSKVSGGFPGEKPMEPIKQVILEVLRRLEQWLS